MTRRALAILCVTLLYACVAGVKPAGAQQDSLVSTRNDSVTVRLVDVDVRAAVQAMARYLDRPVIYGATSGGRVTLETPRPVPRSGIVTLLRGLLDSQGLDLALDSASNTYRVRSRDAARTSAPSVQPVNGGAAGGQELFVIHLRHAKAAEVAATVNALYGRASAFGELGDRSMSSLSRDLTQMRAPASGEPPAPQAVGSVAGRVATLAGETTIVPDSRGNGLLIRASRTDFALIQAAVNELDVRPLQVLIQVLIAEVRRDRTLDFGIDVTLPTSGVHGAPGTTVQGTTTNGGLDDFVLKIMGIGNLKVDAVIRAAASRGDVNILSRPVLLAANNERAEINVGSQRPFVQVSRVLPTDSDPRGGIARRRQHPEPSRAARRQQ